MSGWTRVALAARVEALADAHAGAELVDAVQRLANGLDRRERELLGAVLLERARRDGAFDAATVQRIEARGWLRRQWKAAEWRRRP